MEPLGSGGMSVVWRAEDELLGREVAVKVLSADVSADPASLHRLYAEARAAAGLRHDNVVEVYDYGETGVNGVPMPYVVMELVEGRPLSALLSAGPLPWRLAMLVGAQVAAALAAAHDRGVVHRDVKPANVMVAADGVKLVDFGISAAVGDLDTVAGRIFGTPAYLAPERLSSGMVRPATDVYALGLLLYLMLAGRLPWNASTTTQMLIAHRYRDPAALPAVADLPAEVVDLIRRCLAKNPSDRPPAVAAARILRKAAGLPALTLLTSLSADQSRNRAAETPTEPVSTRSVPVPVVRRIVDGPMRHLVAAGSALFVAIVTVGLVLWPSTARQEPAAADQVKPAALTCRVTFVTRLLATGDSTSTVTVANTAPAAIGAWTLAFRLPGDQRLARGSDAGWRQTGDVLQARGRSLPPGKPVTTTFRTSHGATATLPQSFTLNDVACRSELSVQGVPATMTTARQKVATPKPKPKVTKTKQKARPHPPRTRFKLPPVHPPPHRRP
ncbi:serine/threonine-protein kinase [Actinoplanes sp. NBRC 103695]|uniref:serine/threonine-protein kinase n=1 Tax=Actinoplanes sp. NBRC 103695 TaxID=3032202 RepID=UPI0024A14396|nr:serine/threonine-protein kinase [Actinoplanes sp. NBRC 103695]GLZ02098.1 hypothetical protein Acsp02_93490 [Actinoplanes sp. NBRC 103695]